MSEDWAKSLPVSQYSAPFFINQETLKRLQGCGCDQGLRSQIEEVQKLAKDSNANSNPFIPGHPGVIMLDQYTRLLQKAGNADIPGPGWFKDIAKTALKTTGTAFGLGKAILDSVGFFIKGSRNVLLVVNNTDSDIYPIGDWPKNGERTIITPCLPRRQGGCASAGFFIYDKYEVKGLPLGTYGSLFATTFIRGGNETFTIGMDCPNTFLGGKNAIDVRHGEDRGASASNLEDHHNMYGFIDQAGGKVECKIADNGGSISFGLCIVTGN